MSWYHRASCRTLVEPGESIEEGLDSSPHPFVGIENDPALHVMDIARWELKLELASGRLGLPTTEKAASNDRQLHFRDRALDPHDQPVIRLPEIIDLLLVRNQRVEMATELKELRAQSVEFRDSLGASTLRMIPPASIATEARSCWNPGLSGVSPRRHSQIVVDHAGIAPAQGNGSLTKSELVILWADSNNGGRPWDARLPRPRRRGRWMYELGSKSGAGTRRLELGSRSLYGLRRSSCPQARGESRGPIAGPGLLQPPASRGRQGSDLQQMPSSWNSRARMSCWWMTQS